MWDWIKSHVTAKKVGAVVCGVAAVVLAPVNPLAAVGVGALCGALGLAGTKEYLTAKRLTEIGKSALDAAKRK